MHNELENEVFFTINGHDIHAVFEPINGEGMDSIRDAVRKDNFFLARSRAIREGIKTLTYDGKHIIKPLTRAQRRGKQKADDFETIPNDYDKDTDEFLYDRLIREVVAREPWLALNKAFAEVFEEYAPEDEEDADEVPPRKDPTKSPGGTPTLESSTPTAAGTSSPASS